MYKELANYYDILSSWKEMVRNGFMKDNLYIGIKL